MKSNLLKISEIVGIAMSALIIGAFFIPLYSNRDFSMFSVVQDALKVNLRGANEIAIFILVYGGFCLVTAIFGVLRKNIPTIIFAGISMILFFSIVSGLKKGDLGFGYIASLASLILLISASIIQIIEKTKAKKTKQE